VIGIAASVQPECEHNEDRPGNNGDRHVGAFSSLRLSDRFKTGRRPEEDYEEPNQRLKPDLSDCRRPANHRWNGADGAANDDVLSVCRFSHTDMEERSTAAPAALARMQWTQGVDRDDGMQ
jgi:hypothetical protein